MAKTAIEPEDRKEIIITDNPFERIRAIWDGERFALIKDRELNKTVIILNPKEAKQYADFIYENLYGNK